LLQLPFPFICIPIPQHHKQSIKIKSTNDPAMHLSQLVFSLTFVATAVTAGPAPMDRRAAFTLQNGKDAQALNVKFQSLTASSPCTSGESACVNGQFAQCVGGKFQLTPCAASEQCVALPLVNKPGTR
jgi:hypothetical protein